MNNPNPVARTFIIYKFELAISLDNLGYLRLSARPINFGINYCRLAKHVRPPTWVQEGDIVEVATMPYFEIQDSLHGKHLTVSTYLGGTPPGGAEIHNFVNHFISDIMDDAMGDEEFKKEINHLLAHLEYFNLVSAISDLWR